MSKEICIGYSPCPNDTYIFHAWAHNLIPSAFSLTPFLADVQRLNEMALQKALPVTKLSFLCFGRLQNDYALLHSGAAIGYGCGPKVIAKKPYHLEEIPQLRVAIPGELTTAHLLFSLLCPPPREKLFCLYHEIEGLINSGAADCGVIIHESRFTFAHAGFQELFDLGTAWEKHYSCPLPLGCIAAQRTLGEAMHQQLTDHIRRSIAYARQHPGHAADYIRQHSIEKDPSVIQEHIDLYVNKESESLSPLGLKSINTLLSEANRIKMV